MGGDMKKLYTAIVATLAVLAAACSITQEMKENASFEGLVKVYVEDPVGTREIFAQTGNTAEIDAGVGAMIEAMLESVK